MLLLPAAEMRIANLNAMRNEANAATSSTNAPVREKTCWGSKRRPSQSSSISPTTAHGPNQNRLQPVSGERVCQAWKAVAISTSIAIQARTRLATPRASHERAPAAMAAKMVTGSDFCRTSAVARPKKAPETTHDAGRTMGLSIDLASNCSIG